MTLDLIPTGVFLATPKSLGLTDAQAQIALILVRENVMTYEPIIERLRSAASNLIEAEPAGRC